MAFSLVDEDELAWGAVLSPNQSNGLQRYIQDQFTNVGQYVSEAARRCSESAQKAVELINNSATVSRIRNTISKLRGMIHQNKIQYIERREDFELAPVIMQRYIMAHQGVRRLYHQQRIDGYAGDYVDEEPGKVGIEHYDWRRANHEMFVTDEHGVGYQYFFNEDLAHEEDDLTTYEKSCIHFTWSALDAFMAAGAKDPTSPLGELM